jgi:hypothetical protein
VTHGAVLRSKPARAQVTRSLAGVEEAGERGQPPAQLAGRLGQRGRRVQGPVAVQVAAAEQIEQGQDAALAQHRRQAEAARYAAAKAERRYQAVDPENRLVARGLESAWEKALTELAAAEAELARRQAARPATLTVGERAAVLALGDDLTAVWDSPAVTDKDRKQLLRTLLEEVNITVRRETEHGRADLVLRWKGGAVTELAVPPQAHPAAPAAHRRGHTPSEAMPPMPGARPGASPGSALPPTSTPSARKSLTWNSRSST